MPGTVWPTILAHYRANSDIPLTRKVTSTGQIRIGGNAQSVGRAYASQTLTIRAEAQSREWVVRQMDDTLVKRLPIRGVDVTTLTGIREEPSQDLPPIQLTLPLAAQPRGTHISRLFRYEITRPYNLNAQNLTQTQGAQPDDRCDWLRPICRESLLSLQYLLAHSAA